MPEDVKLVNVSNGSDSSASDVSDDNSSYESESSTSDVDIDVDEQHGGKGKKERKSKQSSESASVISYTSTEILANDPLYFVLSRLLKTSESNKNICDVLEEINDKLGKLITLKSS